MSSGQPHHIIIGAGPAGMGCAHALAKQGKSVLVIEKEAIEGGLCRTIDFNGNLFDIGGHRFFSPSDVVNDLWRDMLGDRLLSVPRSSHIYYREKYFRYPLSFGDAVWKLGPWECLLCVLSYLKAKVLHPGDEATFEGWITNRFGGELFRAFFKSYTEKVWGMDCGEISAQWAQERIKGLSLRVALRNALGLEKEGPKTLCPEFLYPRRGPGEFYAEFKNRIEALGGAFSFQKNVVEVRHDQDRIASIVVENLNDGRREESPVERLFASMPVTQFVHSLSPRPPQDVLESADRLKFRDFLVVNVVLDRRDLFDDQWIYIHAPEVKAARIQNYKNWSPHMVRDPNQTTLGIEYFCNMDDGIWKMDDQDLIAFAMKKIETIGMAQKDDMVDGFVVRQPAAYPVYSIGYEKDLTVVQDYLAKFSNLKCIGRAGTFHYGNSDAALLSGMEAADY